MVCCICWKTRSFWHQLKIKMPTRLLLDIKQKLFLKQFVCWLLKFLILTMKTKVFRVCSKLMQSNRLWVRFCLKSDSKLHLIDMFDPNSWNLITMKAIWLDPNLIETFKVWLNLIKISQDRSKMIKNLTDFDIFNWLWPFWSFSWHFWSFNWFISIFKLKRHQKQLTLIKIRSKLYQNCDHRFDLVIEIQMTKIDDRIRPAWNPNRRWFNSRGLIALA